MPRFSQVHAAWAAGKPIPALALRVALTGLGRALAALVSSVVLAGLLSCGSPAPSTTENPGTLWVSFGQTELDLILIDSEPPYY